MSLLPVLIVTLDTLRYYNKVVTEGEAEHITIRGTCYKSETSQVFFCLMLCSYNLTVLLGAALPHNAREAEFLTIREIVTLKIRSGQKKLEFYLGSVALLCAIKLFSYLWGMAV